MKSLAIFTNTGSPWYTSIHKLLVLNGFVHDEPQVGNDRRTVFVDKLFSKKKQLSRKKDEINTHKRLLCKFSVAYISKK